MTEWNAHVLRFIWLVADLDSGFINDLSRLHEVSSRVYADRGKRLVSEWLQRGFSIISGREFRALGEGIQTSRFSSIRKEEGGEACE